MVHYQHNNNNNYDNLATEVDRLLVSAGQRMAAIDSGRRSEAARDQEVGEEELGRNDIFRLDSDEDSDPAEDSSNNM